MSLKGKVAIVTGASRGIGREIAIELATQGVNVVLVSRNMERLSEVADVIKESGGAAMIATLDATNEVAVSQMVERVEEKYGAIDILVNNAGDAGPTTAVGNLKLEDWNAVIDSSLTSSFLCTKYVVPNMIKRKTGRIINISSASAKAGLPYRVGYCAAKAAIIGFTRSLAIELGRHNINVNTIVPGAVAGDRLDYVIEEQAKLRGLKVEDYRSQFLKNSPLRRVAEPKDIADLVVYLAGESGANITGEDINVTAGSVFG